MSGELNPVDLAAALAHRVCCGTEHDPQNGKLHGYCVVCGVPWPCETASYFLRPNPLQAQLDDRVRMLSVVQDALTQRNRENAELLDQFRKLLEPAKRMLSILGGTSPRHCGMHMVRSVQVDESLAEELASAVTAHLEPGAQS